MKKCRSPTKVVRGSRDIDRSDTFMLRMQSFFFLIDCLDMEGGDADKAIGTHVMDLENKMQSTSA